jgi:hypothetical protein
MASRVKYLPDWYTQGEYSPAAEAVSDSSNPLPETEPRRDVESPAPNSTPPEASNPPAGNEPETPSRDVPHKKASPSPQKTVNKITKELAKNEVVKISEAELDQLITASVVEVTPNKEAEFLKAVKSSIGEEKIDVEMIVDVNKIPWEDLPPRARLAQSLLAQLTSRSSSDLYIKVSGAPVVKDQQLAFDDNATVQIGKLAYPLKDFLNTPGIKQIIPSQIPLNKAPFKDVGLEKGFLVLK